MRIPHELLLAYLAMTGAIGLGLALLVWVVRRPAGVAAALVGPSAFAGTFIGLTATRGMPLSWAERRGIALGMTAMLSCWLLAAGVVVFALRRGGAPAVIQAIGGALTLGVAYLITRAALA